jgi:hypothetical protein
MPRPENRQEGQPPLDAQGHQTYAVSGPDPMSCPGGVIAAVVLGFLFSPLDGLIGFLALPEALTPGEQFRVLYVALALLGLSSSVMYVWGGIVALVGRGRILHLVASGMNVALGLLVLFLLARDPGTGKMSMMVVPTMFVVTVLLIFVVTIAVLMLRPSSTEFLRARRGRGSQTQLVPAKPTSKVRCSKCQRVQAVPRDHSLFVCEECGARLQRRAAATHSPSPMSE